MTVKPSTSDTLVLSMAEDAWQGDAQFTVSVDGVQVGGVQTVTALNAKTQSQNFTITGDFGAGAHNVAIRFLNDAYGGTASTDRNLYLDSLTLDGTTLGNLDVNVANTTTEMITAATPPAGSDTVTVNVSEDAWQGNAQFLVLIDGVQTGGTQTATALHSQGASQTITLQGNYGAGTHSVTVKFINDAWGGTAATDRNLYVNAITYDGTTTTMNASLFSNGSTAPATVSDVPAITRGAVASQASDTLVVYVSEDYYLAHAQFSVTVDGRAVGGTLTASGLYQQGGTTPVTLTGNFGAGPHTVVVTFLNDASGGSSALDRNLYVSGIDYDGSYTGVGASLYWTGASSTTVVGQSGSTPVVPLAQMSTPGTFKYLGVNLSGLEGGGPKYPGVLNTDYVVPTNAEMDYYASQGMNIIRLPFDWERLQPVLNGPLNQTYLALIDGVVAYAKTKGLTVDLDVHNFGKYYGQAVGSAAVPNTAFANLWSQLAAHEASQSNVMFGLMNEPQSQTAAQVLASDQAAINAIRAAGANQEILVPGAESSGGISWTTTSGNASVMDGIVDPKMNFAFEIHQYLDPDGSGTSTAVVSPTAGVQDLTAVTQWAAATGNRLFLGEFGAGNDAASLTAMKNMLTYMGQNTNVWQGATEWGGGPWWGSYIFATDPVNGVTQPQITLLKTF